MMRSMRLSLEPTLPVRLHLHGPLIVGQLCALLLLGAGCSDDGPAADSGADPGADTAGTPDRLPQLVFGSTAEDDLKAITTTADGDLVAAGYTNGAGEGDWDALLLRASRCGEVRWAKTYGGAKKDLAAGVIATADGGLAAVGLTESFGSYVDVYALRTDGAGKLLWSRAYGGNGWDSGTALLATADGGLLLLGETYNFGPGTPDFHNMMLLRVDGAGKLLWDRTFGGDVDGDAGFALAHRFASDGKPLGYAIAGASESYGQGRDDVWLMFLDDSGAIGGSWVYGGPMDDEARSLTPTADGGWLITGFTRGFGAKSSDMFALEVGAKGEVRWMRRYGGLLKERGYGAHPVAEAQGGGWLLTGHTSSFGAGLDDRLALRVDAEGKPQTLRVFGMKGDDKAEASVATIGGHVVLAGRTDSLGAGQRDCWLVTVDVNAKGGCLETTVPLTSLQHAGVLPERLAFVPGIAQGAVGSDAATVVGDFLAPQARTKDSCPTTCVADGGAGQP